jgi:hypothetical protein
MTMPPSTVRITIAGADVTRKVLFRETTFDSQANPMQGTFKIAIKDVDHTFSAHAGQKVALYIDDVPLFGGYIMNIGKGFFFPAADTRVPAKVARKWILTGPDFNLLFDKRVLHNPDDYTSALDIPSGHRTISKAFLYMMNHYLDVPGALDYTTNVDSITTKYGDEQHGALLVGQGKYWREQMDDFMDHGAVIYYIDADFAVHLHEYESVHADWKLSDRPGASDEVGFREGEYNEDFSQMATEALVWGGSTIRQSDGGPGGNIVFARYPNPPANNVTIWEGDEDSERVLTDDKEQDALDLIDTLGRWQLGEERAGQNNYLTLDSVRQRAYSIIWGPPGAVPTYGLESGFNKPQPTMRATWFAHDVPGGAHVRPGYIVDFKLYTQGSGESAFEFSLPLRSMKVSFPTLPSTAYEGPMTWVRFDGDFGVSFSDRRYLWRYLKRLSRRRRNQSTIVTVDTSETNLVYGTFFPLETPNGSRTDFTFLDQTGTQIGFVVGGFDVYIDGEPKAGGVDYTYSSATKTVSFTDPPAAGVTIYVIGSVST